MSAILEWKACLGADWADILVLSEERKEASSALSSTEFPEAGSWGQFQERRELERKDKSL